MKTLLIILFCSIYTLTNEKLDKCNGIGNYIFGAPKNQFKNITLEFEQGNAQLYTVNENPSIINGVELDYLRISFIKNKLSAISISTKNSTGAVFFKYLKEKYGAPVKNKNQFEWSGKHANITLELYNKNKDASIDFYSK